MNSTLKYRPSDISLEKRKILKKILISRAFTYEFTIKSIQSFQGRYGKLKRKEALKLDLALERLIYPSTY